MTSPQRPVITFGTDGWRGIIADDFTGTNVRLVARAAANYFLRPDVPGKPTVFVGYDNRSQSEFFAAEAARVLASAGFATVISSTSCSSPAVAYACHRAGAKGAVMITASHNPPQFNGLKIKMGYGGSALPSVVAEVETELNRLLDAGVYTIDIPERSAGEVETRDFRQVYLDGLRSMVDLELIGKSGYKIVVDPMHGSGSGYLSEILSGAGLDVVEIRGDRNPVFGGVNPEPITQNLGALRAAIAATAADAGFAVDGDADRVGAMDANGAFVDSHRIFALALRHLFEDRGMRGSVVKTVSTTRLIDKLCAKYGLPLRVVPIGFKSICEWMLKEDVLIGGEESGGIGVQGFIPERDGPLMSMIMIEAMAARGKRLEAQIAELMAEFGPHEYNRIDVRTQAARMPGIIRYLRDENPAQVAGLDVAHIERMDGTRFDFENGSWLLLRASGTEPVVRVYAESTTQDNVQSLLDAGLAIVHRI